MRLGNDLHVDGGLVNNLPIDVMIAKPEIGAVIAVDVGAELEMAAPAVVRARGVRLARAVGAVRAASRRGPAADHHERAGAQLLRRQRLLDARAPHRGAGEPVSAHSVADLRLLAFERIDAIAARGYDATREAIRTWWAARR